MPSKTNTKIKFFHRDWTIATSKDAYYAVELTTDEKGATLKRTVFVIEPPKSPGVK